MYETEANSLAESPAQIPAEVMRSFERLRGKVRSRTVLPWSEHCTECVWPTCYTTCELYTPRQDGDVAGLPMAWCGLNLRPRSTPIW